MFRTRDTTNVDFARCFCHLPMIGQTGMYGQWYIYRSHHMDREQDPWLDDTRGNCPPFCL